MSGSGAAAPGHSMQNRGDGPCELVEVIDRVRPSEVRGDPARLLVREVLFDHRRVASADTAGTATSGDLFCCLPGEHRDGHDFATAARQRGAVAFICERPLGDAAGGAVELVVGPGRARAAMALAACVRHRDPAAALRTVGVTGTNGKTTTTHLLAGILGANGWPTTVIGTLSGARTTPESPELQQQLADARRLGSAAVAMEVTSHALVQHRVDGYVHDVAVFTNLSRDHLDYHGTMETYFEAKASLFTPEHAKAGVVNGDDPWGARLLEQASVPVEAFSMQQVSGVEIGLGGSRFRLRGELVELRLAGELNVRNAVAAAAAARALGVGEATIAEGLSSAPPVPGRFEPVDNDLGLGVVVDYAHTPAALAEALAVMRPMVTSGRLIVVFGAGGDRDREKRPEMGREVSHLADIAVLTSDNPRHEDPDEIMAEVRAGWQGSARLEVERDRRQAIARALSLATPADLVLVAGKGHETTQQLHDDLLPFDDRLVVREEAARLAGTLPAGVA